MTRAGAAFVIALLAGALALAPAPEPLADDAQASDCTWQRHSKRIVKRVKRQGRTHRLVRKRHWWTCERAAAATTPAGTPPAPSTTPGPTPPASPAPPALGYLSVKAHEYSYTLSRPSVLAGEAIVELNNQGEDPHNLNLQREGDAGPPLEVDEAGSLEHRTARFALPAGTYRLWCSLPEHEEKGMKATLLVDGG